MNNTERNLTAPRHTRLSPPPVLQALIFIAATAVLGFSTLVIAATSI